MSLDQSQYEALVRRMEQLAQRTPRAYRWRVLALAGLGFLYLLLLVAGLVFLILALAVTLRHAMLLGAKLIAVLGALLWVVLRSLWVRLEPPPGEPVLRSQSPALFARLDRLCARLDAPRINNLLITEEFNAAVTQVPRLGILGWHRTYLLLGLPLMKCLSVEQLDAVLAHELGHLARGHARLGNWIYRSRQVWQRLGAALHARPQWGSGLILRFFEWYIPYFNACSFPLARQNEFEADASSTQLVSPLAAAQALTSTNVLGYYFQERYWPAIHAGARDSERPGFAPYTGMSAPTLEQLDDETARRWLARALEHETTYHDTHPSLRARLEAIGMQPELAFPAPAASAERLLGARAGSLAATFDARWQQRVAPSWAKFYENTQKNRARLQQLHEQAACQALPTEQTLELATLEEDVGQGAAASLALRRAVVARDPGSALARFHLARQLLMAGEPEGVAMMQAVIEAQPDAVLGGSQLLRDYWWGKGERALAEHWHRRALERDRALRAAGAAG